MRPALLHAICLAMLAGLAACGGPPAPKQVMLYPPECRLMRATGEIADSVSVALPDPVKPEVAPWARNASERLLFHHLYETLITVDCRDEVQPGLAASWKRSERGRRWTFELRDDARFWDGSRVSADDVVASWRDLAVHPDRIDALIDSVGVVSERVVYVHFRERQREVPRALCAPPFAVVKPSDDTDWLLGSGPYRIVEWKREPSSRLRRTITVRPASRARAPVIRFSETRAADARDLLDAGTDLIVSDDPAVIEYAAARPRLEAVALPWLTSYVLLSTTRILEFRGGGRPDNLTADVLDGIARDAVRGDARGCGPPAWWDDVAGCAGLSAADVAPYPLGAPSSTAARRIVYDGSDRTARDLAERLVALSAAGPDQSPEAAAVAAAVPGLAGGVVVAEGVSPGALARSLRAGDDFAYIVAIPRQPPDRCYEAQRLVGGAPWLRAPGVDLDDALVPLVDTRPHVIVTRDRFGLILDGYGNVLVTGEMAGEK